MNSPDLIKYRYSRAVESYEEATILAEANHWNAAANRLYYACFYAVNALLLKSAVNFTTHKGVKTEFHRLFIKTTLISKESGRTYNRLFNLRQEGDYLDFKRLEKNDVIASFEDTKLLISEIANHLNLHQ